MNTQSVFVIEDDSAVRDSLLTLLRGEGIMARGFASGRDFFANLPEEVTACVVTDIRMPDMDGVEVVRRLGELHGRAWPIIVMTGHADVPLAVQMMKAGIVDFVEKPFDPVRMIETVRGCMAHLADIGAERRARSAGAQKLSRLTPRERQVFDGLISGRSNKEIAIELKISPRTVEIFRAKVMTKMEADSLPTLVRIGLSVATNNT